MNPMYDLIQADLARAVKEDLHEALSRMRYQQRIDAERRAGRAYVRRLTRQLRRDVLGPFPDSIDKEDAEKLHAAFKRVAAAAEKARTAFFKPFLIDYNDSFDKDLRDWQAKARIEVSVHPIINPARVALITSPA